MMKLFERNFNEQKEDRKKEEERLRLKIQGLKKQMKDKQEKLDEVESQMRT